MWGLVRSLDGGRLGWAVLCGAAAAGAMLTKYWSLFLMLAMATTVLFDQRRNAYFRSPAPYVAAAVFLILTVPHLVWLIQNDFPPLRWVGVRRTAHSPIFWWRAFTNYILGTVAYGSAAVLLFLLGTRPSSAAIWDSLWPSDRMRRRTIPLYWVPLLAPLIVAIVRNIQLISLWNIPALNLLPVVLLNSDRIKLPRFSVKVMAIVALSFPLAMIPVAPCVAYYKIRYSARITVYSPALLATPPLRNGMPRHRRRCAFSQARSGWLRPHPPICRNIRSSIRISRAICRPGSISNASTGRAWRLSSRPMTHVGFARCANGRAAPTSRKCR